MSPGPVVVDASALVAAVADADLIGTRARERLRDCRRVAPFLVDAEVGSALRSMVLRGEIGEKAAESARLLAERMVHRRHPHHGVLASRAWQLRQSVSFYDALYVALAERLDCPLITADKRIARALPHNDQIYVIASTRS
ncbi:type II toxin-antitoxin system VapC family toxin [Candidatus Poriferisocius sp.]|uniref:type II toxin-antitoxin system VapC family toxin n=1 Tax=Candidatus Poriferisocius sp. TaxID=3101276 RepID=UPI003B02B464